MLRTVSVSTYIALRNAMSYVRRRDRIDLIHSIRVALSGGSQYEAAIRDLESAADAFTRTPEVRWRILYPQIDPTQDADIQRFAGMGFDVADGG